MDEADLRQHQLDQTEQAQLACASGIGKYVHSPVWDDKTDDATTMVWNACLQLHKLVNEEHEKVFVHCGAGVSRSSTVLLTFLALFGIRNMVVDGEEHDQYVEQVGFVIFSPDALFQSDPANLVEKYNLYLKNYHRGSHANLGVVHRAIAANKEFLEEMRRRALNEQAAERERLQRL
jgi:hypothetical protein